MLVAEHLDLDVTVDDELLNERGRPRTDLPERARAKPSATSAREWAIRMPLPPPAEALIITG
jgi:hypothetical protein